MTMNRLESRMTARVTDECCHCGKPLSDHAYYAAGARVCAYCKEAWDRGMTADDLAEEEFRLLIGVGNMVLLTIAIVALLAIAGLFW